MKFLRETDCGVNIAMGFAENISSILVYVDTRAICTLRVRTRLPALYFSVISLQKPIHVGAHSCIVKMAHSTDWKNEHKLREEVLPPPNGTTRPYRKRKPSDAPPKKSVIQIFFRCIGGHS